MSFPAGRKDWAWEWMGFVPPSTYSTPLEKKYHKFRQCFDSYYGIGDFDYWKRYEISKLTDNEKIELVQCLLESFKKEEPDNVRDYVGLLPNGSINKDIEEYSDGRKFFFETLTIEECRKREYPHNQRCRFENGFHCDDCNTFFPNDSDEWKRTEGVSNCSIILYNKGVDYLRVNMQIPSDILQLQILCHEYKLHPFAIPIEQIESLITKCKNLK